MIVHASSFPFLVSCAAVVTMLVGVPAHAQRNQSLYDRATAVQPDAVKLLERLINIDSGTFSEAGLTQVGAIAAQELKAWALRSS